MWFNLIFWGCYGTPLSFAGANPNPKFQFHKEFSLSFPPNNYQNKTKSPKSNSRYSPDYFKRKIWSLHRIFSGNRDAVNGGGGVTAYPFPQKGTAEGSRMGGWWEGIINLPNTDMGPWRGEQVETGFWSYLKEQKAHPPQKNERQKQKRNHRLVLLMQETGSLWGGSVETANTKDQASSSSSSSSSTLRYFEDHIFSSHSNRTEPRAVKSLSITDESGQPTSHGAKHLQS